MENSRTKAEYSVKDIKSAERGRYETFIIVAWKTWNGNPTVSSKGGGNKS